MHVDHECDVHHALPGRDVGEVTHPQRIRTLGLELPLHPVQRAWRCLVTVGGLHDLAANHAVQAQPAHQPLRRASCHLPAFAQQLLPDLPDAVHLPALVPDPANVRLQRQRSSSAWAKYADVLRRISLACRSSRFSRSSAFIGARSSVLRPGRSPSSRSARRTQLRSVCAVHPLFIPTELLEPASVPQTLRH